MKKLGASLPASPPSALNTDGSSELETFLNKINSLLDSGKAQEALRLVVGRNSGSPVLQNARAVCLMRTGRPDEAVSALRAATIAGGTTSFRMDTPVLYELNLAIALAMSGNAIGTALDASVKSIDRNPDASWWMPHRMSPRAMSMLVSVALVLTMLRSLEKSL
jgi:hypothetical protein